MSDIFQMALDRKEVVADMDGFYKYWPKGKGCLTADDLRIIANGLDRINVDWQKQLDEYFETEHLKKLNQVLSIENASLTEQLGNIKKELKENNDD